MDFDLTTRGGSPMDGPTDIHYELTDRGRRYLILQSQIAQIEANLYLNDADEMTRTQMRAELHNLEEEAFRLLNEP
jgi:DNA-binding PadR family transcriptional regulator